MKQESSAKDHLDTGRIKSLEHLPADDNDDSSNVIDSWIRSTVNQRGVMVKHLASNSQAFVDFAATNATTTKQYPVVDMGCAYGVATLPCMARGAKVIACDLEPKHLAEVQKIAAQKGLEEHLRIQAGQFPQEFAFERHSIAAFHSSFLFHFLTGEELMTGLAKIKEWLIPGGKVFLNVGTPSHPYLVNFEQEYERRVKEGDCWPGEVRNEDLERYLNPLVKENHPPEAIPCMVHLLDMPILSQALRKSGFTIEHVKHFNYEWPKELAPIYGTGEMPCMLEALAHT